jgi:hypothetical protein
MINIGVKKCNHKNCNIYPSYNYEDNNKHLYCNKHKLEGMVNVKGKKTTFIFF